MRRRNSEFDEAVIDKQFSLVGSHGIWNPPGD